MILIFASVAAVASPSPAPSPDPCGGAQTNLLATLNRPSIGYSACSVKPGETVAEAGYANAAGAANLLATYPQGFLRFGAAPKLELDLVGPAYGVQEASGVTSRGYFDTGVGAKYEWWHDSARAFATDVLYTAPTGAAAFTAGAPIATLNFDYSAPISSRFGFATTLGLQSDYAQSSGGTSARFFSTLPSIVISDQWNPRAQAFFEVFGQTRTRPDGGAQLGEDVALQYLLTPALEADVEMGRTANDIARSHYAGFGFGARF